MKILFLKGISQYGAMRDYIDQWNFHCRQMGHETYLFDAMSGYTTEQLLQLSESLKPELILCCNAIYAELADRLMGENTRYCTVLYDNPVIHRKRLEGLDERAVVCSCDRYYAEFIREHYPNIGRVSFLPLSGSRPSDTVPYRERTKDVIFTGSYFNLDKLYSEIKQLPDNIRAVLENVIGIMLEEPHTLLWQAVDQFFEERGISLTGEARFDMIHLCTNADLFVRAYVRDQVLRSLIDGGVPVHIYGNGWDRFSCSHPERLLLHEGYGEVSLAAVADSRISLNVMPWFRGGIQERNIAAMLSGTVSLTDTSDYIEENFEDGKDIVLYSLKQTDRLPFIAHSLLANPDRAEEIAENGYQKAAAGHTWEHRMKELFEEILG